VQPRYDAIIVGGGLAGLTLARQLRLEAPACRILVVEKRRHPVPEAAHKVGESTVEIGANYYYSILGLAPQLHEQQLPKFGLRYFFPHDGNHELTCRIEVGLRGFSPIPSFQLDRGRFENTLLELERNAGTEVVDGCSVSRIELGDGAHEVSLATAAGERTETARWIVDASGRAGLLRRQLGLGRPVSHAANASWFRISSRVAIDDWSEDTAWRARVPTRQRWLSTNHLMGPGYWVWLIPLGSGSTSFGIVVDAAMHPFERIDRFPRALDWLREFEPQCARIVEAHASELQDFRALKNYAFGCTRMYSADRWALTGEAGVFTDPFYSPGSDFIAMGNESISELIKRDLAGEDIRATVETYNRTFFRLFEAFLRVYDGQYRMMGSAQAMTAKISWDNASYWAVSALLFLQRRFRRPDFLERIEGRLRNFSLLHARMQQLFHAWAEADTRQYAGAWVNVLDIDDLRRLQADLTGPIMDDPQLCDRLDRNFGLLQSLAKTWQTIVAERHPQLPRFINVESDAPLMNLEALNLDAVAVTEHTGTALNAGDRGR
jgi:flavin-dependent dehydrogenase